jgi:hypothetical protein
MQSSRSFSPLKFGISTVTGAGMRGKRGHPAWYHAARSERNRRAKALPGRYDGLVKQLIACATLMTAFSLAGSGQPGSAASLAQVKTVYLLPMSRGMDQYLANRLTHDGVVQVVTDPSKADALLTDALGEAFEAKVKELYPEAKPVVAPAKPDEKKKEANEPPAGAKPDELDLKSSGPAHATVPARSRGTIFLVKRGTGEVLWSAYNDPAIRLPKDLNRTAGKIADGLKKAISPASPSTPGGK